MGWNKRVQGVPGVAGKFINRLSLFKTNKQERSQFNHKSNENEKIISPKQYLRKDTKNESVNNCKTTCISY